MVDKERHNKTTGIILLFVFATIAIATSILATSPLIKDSDPASYIIVVMLMVPVLVLFSAKENLSLDRRLSSIICGLVLLLVIVLLISVLRGYLSFAFYSFRIDALLFPLVLAAVALPLFGFGGLKKLKALLIYSVFASPLLFYFLINNQNLFVNWNANIVYGLLKALGLPLVRNGVTFTALAGNISIASTCAALGIFIAMFLFLVPVAYLYNGRKSRKVAWLIVALVLFLLLNILRMTSIGLIWSYYGVNSALSVYHTFIGQFLFYITIAVMLLVAGRFGLSLEQISLKTAFTQPLVDLRSIPWANVIAALAIALLMALFTAPYLTLSGPSLATFSRSLPANSTQIYLLEAKSLGSSGYVIDGLGIYSNQSYFAMNSNSIGENNGTIYAIGVARPSPIPVSLTLNKSDVATLNAYILRGGITIYSGHVVSNSTNFTINFFSLPMSAYGTSFTAGYELVSDNASAVAYCPAGGYFADQLESNIYNLLSGQKLPAPRIMCPAYQVALSG